jgi:pyridoxamine 5'-phosphate oxidase family protein
MTLTRTASQQITDEVVSWPGIVAGPGRRGEFAFKLGRREIGHLHGDHAAHFSFPNDVWVQLRTQERIVEHPVFPGRVGPAARTIRSDADVRDVIALLRMNYDRFANPADNRLANPADDGLGNPADDRPANRDGSSRFSDDELAYLRGERRLARLATVGQDGTPHVVPVGFRYNPERDSIDVAGRDLTHSKKYRDVKRAQRAAIVVDDLKSTSPWRPRAVEVRGRAEIIEEPSPLIRIHPDRVISWGLSGS